MSAPVRRHTLLGPSQTGLFLPRETIYATVPARCCGSPFPRLASPPDDGRQGGGCTDVLQGCPAHPAGQLPVVPSSWRGRADVAAWLRGRAPMGTGDQIGRRVEEDAA